MNMSGIKIPKLGPGLKSATPTAPKMPGVISPVQTSTSVKAPMKVGTQAVVKTPKSKKLPDATDKPSVFFKSEKVSNLKKSSIRKLRDFLERTRSK